MRAKNIELDYGPDHVTLKARIGERQLAMLEAQGSQAQQLGKHDASGNGWGNPSGFRL